MKTNMHLYLQSHLALTYGALVSINIVITTDSAATYGAHFANTDF